ncbi:13574_t:CDS:1, partial [Racocetra fulgida]
MLDNHIDLSSVEFEEIVNMTDIFLTNIKENVNNASRINENKVASEDKI